MDAQQLMRFGNKHEVEGIGFLNDGKIYHALLNFSVAMHCYKEAGELTDSDDCKRYIQDLIERYEFSDWDFKAFVYYGRETVRNNLNKAEFLEALTDAFSLMPKPENKTQNTSEVFTDFPVYKSLGTKDIGERKNFN